MAGIRVLTVASSRCGLVAEAAGRPRDIQKSNQVVIPRANNRRSCLFGIIVGPNWDFQRRNADGNGNDIRCPLSWKALYPPLPREGKLSARERIEGSSTASSGGRSRESTIRCAVRWGLSRGELDWVEWRINCFLGQASDADSPMLRSLEGVAADTIARRTGTYVDIEEHGPRTTFHFPNSTRLRTFSGIGSTIIGLGASSYFPRVALQAWRAGFGEKVWLLLYVLLAIIGMLSLVSGLTRLFGRKRLTISPEKIVYRATLFGVGPWLTLPTADVISVGVRNPLPTARRRRSHVVVATMDYGGVIRTPDGEIAYGSAVPAADRPWVFVKLRDAFGSRG